MKIKRFLGYKIVFLPSGKVLGFNLRLGYRVLVWESREAFMDNVQQELTRSQLNYRRDQWYAGLPIITAVEKPYRAFWLKEELAALRKANKNLEKHLLNVTFDYACEWYESRANFDKWLVDYWPEYLKTYRTTEG